MDFRSLIFLLLSTFLFLQCSNEPDGLTVSGDVENSADLTAFIDHKNLDGAIQPIANAEVSSEGEFSMNFPEGLEAGIYRVRIGAKGVDLILRGDERKVHITGDINNFDKYDYNIEGSEISEKYREQIAGIINKTRQKSDIDAYMRTDIDPLLVMTLSLATAPPSPAHHANYSYAAEQLKAKYPEAKVTEQFGEFAHLMEKQYKMQQAKYKVQEGQPAPEIAMEDPQGKIRKLSDLQGKVVLLDFWASWCGPCRRANPHLVETYHKYKDQGFTVFSVSLDGIDSRTKARIPDAQVEEYILKQKQRWLDAIAKDRLTWDHHVSDLKKWESDGAAMYGVRSIPTTFLIDRDGKIAAVNPRNNLEEEIKKII